MDFRSAIAAPEKYLPNRRAVSLQRYARCSNAPLNRWCFKPQAAIAGIRNVFVLLTFSQPVITFFTCPGHITIATLLPRSVCEDSWQDSLHPRPLAVSGFRRNGFSRARGREKRTITLSDLSGDDHL